MTEQERIAELERQRVRIAELERQLNRLHLLLESAYDNAASERAEAEYQQRRATGLERQLAAERDARQKGQERIAELERALAEVQATCKAMQEERDLIRATAERCGADIVLHRDKYGHLYSTTTMSEYDGVGKVQWCPCLDRAEAEHEARVQAEAALAAEREARQRAEAACAALRQALDAVHICEDCGGSGIASYTSTDGRPIACETCGGHEDSEGALQ